MSIAKRLSYSLLFSTLAFAVFSAVAFSGLFPWIEAQFYSPRIVADMQGRLDQASTVIEVWKKSSLEKLDKLLSDGVFEAVFSPTASQATLQKRFQQTKLFLLGVHGGGSLRVLNGDRTQVHFSTEDGDVKVRSDFSITYRTVAEVNELPDLRSPALDDGHVHILMDPSGTSVSLLRPWKDPRGLLPGFILCSLSLEDLRFALLEAGVSFSSQPISAVGPESYLFSLLGQKADPSILTRVKDLRSRGIVPPVQRLARADGQFTVALIQKGPLSVLVPTSSLEMSPLLKALLLISFYTVLFLVSFLVANFRGEPLSVVTRKVKRFQLQVVKQYLDLKEGDKIQSLRDELARHSDEIRSDVRHSLGRVRKRDRDWVDRYIDTSWQEVMDLLRGPAPPVESSSNADWKRLETLLQQALTQGRFVVSGAPSAPAPSTLPQARVQQSEGEAEEVEDLEEAEELESVEEAEAPVVPGQAEAELVEELVAEVEELEELEELEEVTDEDTALMPKSPEGPAARNLPKNMLAVDDGEELEELEADEAGGQGALEEIPSLRQSADLYHARRPAAESVVVAELPRAEADDLEELDELEEVLDELEEDGQSNDTSYSLEKLDSVWGSSETGVFDESENVVTLRDELFQQSASGQDDFGMLVDEVLAGPEGSAFVPLEEEFVPKHSVREWRWTGGGFDWDRFALGTDEVSLFRALSEIVTELDAFTAAILTERQGVWTAQNNVGFSDSGKTLLEFGPEHPLSKSFLSIRALHVLNGGGTHPMLRQSFHVKDLKFLKTIALVPLLFRHEPAWLLLGMRKEPEDLLSVLAPRRVE